jgi:uncharacterized protein (TIGR03083 family)
MDVSEYIGHVAAEGKRFADTADGADLGIEIPACAGWDMRELVRHLGLIHLWAAANVAYPQDELLDPDDLPDLAGHWPELAADWPDDTDLVAWYRSTLDNLVRVLDSAPPDHQCATFLPAPTPLTMWSRRQASEIAIHRFDAEAALGLLSSFEPRFATDMLDELLSGFAPRKREIPVDAAKAILVHAEDVDEKWLLTIGPDGMTTSRRPGDADLSATGTAAALYLLFWNRTPDSTVALRGESDLMELWRGNCRVRWS